MFVLLFGQYVIKIHSMMKFMLNLMVKPASIKYNYTHKGTRDLMLALLTPLV